MSAVSLCEAHAGHRQEVRAQPSQTLRELKEAISSDFPGKPPVALLRLFSGDRELRGETDALGAAAPELFRAEKPVLGVDLALPTMAHEDSRSMYQAVDRLNSTEARIEAYAATHATLKYFLDLLVHEDPSEALAAAEDGPAGGRAPVEDEAADQVADVLSRRMEVMRDLLMGQLQAVRDERSEAAAEGAEEDGDTDRVSSLISSGTLAGRAKRHAALNFNTDLRSAAQMMLGLGLVLRFGDIAPTGRSTLKPYVKPLAHLLTISLVVILHTRPVRLATKVALNLLPQAAVHLAASALGAQDTALLSQDYASALEDLHGAAAPAEAEAEAPLAGVHAAGDGAAEKEDIEVFMFSREAARDEEDDDEDLYVNVDFRENIAPGFGGSAPQRRQAPPPKAAAAAAAAADDDDDDLYVAVKFKENIREEWSRANVRDEWKQAMRGESASSPQTPYSAYGGDDDDDDLYVTVNFRENIQEGWAKQLREEPAEPSAPPSAPAQAAPYAMDEEDDDLYIAVNFKENIQARLAVPGQAAPPRRRKAPPKAPRGAPMDDDDDDLYVAVNFRENIQARLATKGAAPAPARRPRSGLLYTTDAADDSTNV